MIIIFLSEDHDALSQARMEAGMPPMWDKCISCCGKLGQAYMTLETLSKTVNREDKRQLQAFYDNVRRLFDGPWLRGSMSRAYNI